MKKPSHQILREIYDIAESDSDEREVANRIQSYMQSLTCIELISTDLVCRSLLEAIEMEAERKYQLGDHTACRRHDDD